MSTTFYIILLIIVCIRLILILLYAGIYPEKSILFGDKFKYNNDLKPKKSYVKLIKTISIIFLIIFSSLLIISLICIYISKYWI